MAERGVPLAAVMAVLCIVIGLAVVTRTTVAALLIASAITFAGSWRLGAWVLVLLVTAGMAGVRVDASDRQPTRATSESTR